MKFLQWEQGRQGTGYERLTLIVGGFLPLDLHILRYRPGDHVPPHTDPVEFGRHYRLNIILTKAKGGEFHCANTIFETSRIKLFRPDLEEHSVTLVTRGTRYVLSIGWVLPEL
jgi:hypothetical protein